MRVLVLSSGRASGPAGIGALGTAVAARGPDIRLLVPYHAGAAPREPSGIETIPVGEAPPVIPADDAHRLERALALATRFSAAAIRSLRDRPADVVVADGWDTAYAACNLRASEGLPILARLHDTHAVTAGADDRTRLITQIEWWLTYEARRVVVPNERVRQQLVQSFQLPPEKVVVVPPGVSVPGDSPPPPNPRRLLLAPAGRGMTTLARALRGLGVRVSLARTDDVRGVERAGIVVILDRRREDLVLAAMAAARVVVVADDEPLGALVDHGVTGLHVADRDEVVVSVTGLLEDRDRCMQLARAAGERTATTHAWPPIAAAYEELLHETIEEEAALRDHADRATPLRPVLLRSPFVNE